jgi:carbon storage regulator
MLVLSRRLGESVFIGNDVAVSILEIRGGQVRIGISAPPSVKIVRDELAIARADARPNTCTPPISPTTPGKYF